jgi:hypothetical protein
MRWEDERYVRVYTRDTVDWQGLSFDAQALFVLLLRKVDRAGILDLGKPGKRGVAVAIGHAREWARLEPALEELLTDGCARLVDDGRRLLVPNFIAAQEAKASDKSRQQKSRETARDVAAAESVLSRDAESHGVTVGHMAGQNVTSGHDASRAVTPSRAVPSLAVPSFSLSAGADEPEELPDATDDAQPVAQPPLFAVETPPEKPKRKTGPDPETLRAVWNRVAPPLGFQVWEAMGDDRKRDARLALEACPDLAKWEAWLRHELARPWNRGENSDGWKANVAWFLRKKNRDLVIDFSPTAAQGVRTASGGDVPRLGPRPVVVAAPSPNPDKPRL